MPLVNPSSGTTKGSVSLKPSVSNTASEGINFSPTVPRYSFRDLILSAKTLDELETIVHAQQNWKKVFESWGLGKVLKDKKNLFVNLYGAPGTGKTMAAHAIADALGQKLICVNYADIESKYVGETSKNLARLFDDPQNAGHIIFFDEADALLSKRVTDMTSANDVSVNQTRSVLLTLLNTYDGMVIFATNFIKNYDVAFLRRIQFHVQFELPNAELRLRLWQMYIPEEMPTDADLTYLADICNGLSGSDISTVVLKAALKAARTSGNIVRQSDFEEAIMTLKNSQAANSGVIHKTEIVSEDEVPPAIREKLNDGSTQQ